MRTVRTAGRRTGVWTAACLAAAVAAAAWASFAPGATRAPRMQLRPNPARAGHFVRIRGILPKCRVGNRVTLMSKAFVRKHEFAGVPAVFAKVRTHHRYRVRARVKAGLKPGRYKVTGRCGGGNLGASVSLRVRR